MFTNPYENATTLWESFHADQSVPGGSRNHIMFGSVGAWFYTHLAGIDLSSDIITIRPRMASEAKKYLMKKLDCQLSRLYVLVHISYTRDEPDTIANSILLRIIIPPNVEARFIFEPLFVGGKCTTLIEGDRVMYSTDATIQYHSEFDVEKDTTTGLMTVHIASGQYEFQALWK